MPLGHQELATKHVSTNEIDLEAIRANLTDKMEMSGFVRESERAQYIILSFFFSALVLSAALLIPGWQLVKMMNSRLLISMDSFTSALP